MANPLADAVPLPISDANYDALVDSADFVNFVAAWVVGKGSADINQDGVVDQVDMDLYLSAFIDES